MANVSNVVTQSPTRPGTMFASIQNEMNDKDAQQLINNGAIVIAEASNMGCTAEVAPLAYENGVLFGPGIF